ncbi:tyrosine-protein kinase [uncultured Alistipes sp.]|uniref:GumC family protein n=1 Tax=uncultured Alistipes sp. TaxID=538949 RepID=UPI0025D9FF97|nr:tyrosine-protein kinase [uncultured Alistipes sp.]
MNKKNDNYLTIANLKEIVADNFWLFFISVAAAVSIAVGYIIITPPTYQRSASVLIKDDAQSKTGNSIAPKGFEEIGLFNLNTNINNEINIMRAPFLMEEVVKRLKLDYNYSLRYKRVRMVDLYNGTPIRVEMDSVLTVSNVAFRVDILSDTDYSLTGFSVNGRESDFSARGKFADTLQTRFGNISITKTVVFSPTSKNKEIYFTKSSVRSVTGSLLSRLSVAVDNGQTSIINLSITDGVGQRAEDVLNTLISVYNENWIKDRNMITVSTSDFISERLKVIERELGGVDEDISAYKSRNLLPDVTAVANIQLAQSTTNTNRQLALNNQLSMAQYIKQYMQDATTRDRLLPANSGIENGAIENQIAKYNELLLQKNNLLANSSESNPIVADMITKLAAMKDIIILSIDDLIGSLTLQVENTRRQAKVNDAKLATNPTQAKYLLSVERQQKVKEELYLFLLQKREEMELSQAFTAYNTRLLVPAGGSNAPIKPKRLVILAFSLIVGLSLPVIYLLFKEMWNTTVQDRKDLEGLTIPFAGSIPLLSLKSVRKKNKKGYQPMVVIEDKNRDVANEAFRVIRSNVDFMSYGEKRNKVLLFISFLSGSGKSFISANLAIAEAIKGSKILIIDTDLRKAALSTYVDSPATGLSGYLSGKVEHIDDVIVKGKLHPNLDVIPSGAIPPNPSELLLTERFGRLIGELRQRYDYIYLDCTPIEILPDAAIVAKHCDMSVFIVRAGLMDKHLLPELEQIYQSKRYKDMCLILNGVKYNHRMSYYRKYGYYGGYGVTDKQ